MEKREIYIGKSYIEEIDEKRRLCAEVSYDNRKQVMFFEVKKHYGRYLTTGVADPFVLMILEYAMARSYNILCEEPVTDTLWYNLQTFWIPILAKNTKTFKFIRIICNLCEEKMENIGRGVGTGLSCGVDSFYTILRYKTFGIKKYQLTHLFFLNQGAMGKQEYEESENVFNKEKEHIEKAAQELEIELVCMNTNMMSFYKEIYGHRANNNEGIKIAAAIYAVRKLIGIYYIASSFGLEKFRFSDKSVGYFAPFTAQAVSTDYLKFYIGDVDESERIEKVRIIADNPIVQKYIHVDPICNCGHCPKCIRTELELYVLGKIDLFYQAFDVENFKKTLVKRYAYYLANNHEREVGYLEEIQRFAKKNGVKLPIASYLLAIVMWIPINNKVVNSAIKKVIHYKGKW